MSQKYQQIIFYPSQPDPQEHDGYLCEFLRDIKPHKKGKHRVRLTVGGNILKYHAEPSAPAVGILDTKIHLNSVISNSK